MSIPTVYFRFLVGSAIIFRMFLIKTFLHFVHSCLFIILRSEVPNTKAPKWPWPLVHLVGECVGLTSVALGKVLLCHTLRSVVPTPSPSEMRHVLVLACTCGGKKNGKR